MIYDIVQLGDPVLRRKAHKVSHIDKDMRILANDMIETLHDAGGVGLAAPQIGESIRMIIVEYPEDDTTEDSPKKTYTVINPEITWRSEETVMGVEGCLSVVGMAGNVERNESVKVRGLNMFGRPFSIKADGWLARIFQHEIDHLDGICYVDRAEEVWKPEERPDDEMDETEVSPHESTETGEVAES